MTRALTRADVDAAIAAAQRPLPTLLLRDDDGSLPGLDNTACLRRRPDGTWMTAWFERGSYHDLRVHDTEDAACRAFLAYLSLPVPPG